MSVERGAVVLGIPGATSHMAAVVANVVEERVAQEAKWGQQNHPNGTGGETGIEPFGYADAADLADWLAKPEPDGTVADFMRHRCEVMFSQGSGTYEAILTEEWGEAVSEPDPAKLRAELIQVAAVAIAWAEKIDRASLAGGRGDAP